MQSSEPQFAGFGVTPEAAAGQGSPFGLPQWPTGQQVAPGAQPTAPPPQFQKPMQAPAPQQQPQFAPQQAPQPQFQKPMQAPAPQQQQFAPQQAPQPQFQKPMQAPQQFAQQPPQQAPAQAAPVPPVACPAYTPPGGHQAQQQGQQQHPAVRQMTAIARALEQSIPGYQIMISVFQELQDSPKAQALQGAQLAGDLIRDAVYHQYAALGAIRRFLCGEASPEVMTALALNINQLMALHNQVRPLVERMVMGASPDLRPVMTGLSQLLTPGGNLLTQASGAVQQLVGPRIWDAAATKAVPARTGAEPAATSQE